VQACASAGSVSVIAELVTGAAAVVGTGAATELDDAAEPHAARPQISARAPSPAQIFLVFMISPQGNWISWSGSEPAVTRPVLLSTVNQPLKVWVAPV
jgi:hypothetical protein